MKPGKLIICIGVLLVLIGSCKRDQLKPIENDKDAPAPVTNAVAENLPGAARITYSLPPDPDLLYIEAVYKSREGKSMQFKSSFYTNSILVEGFADTAEQEVAVYAVDRSENHSPAVLVKIRPQTPPVAATRQSLEVVPDFGGISIRFKNKTKADLAILVSTPDSLGDMVNVQTFYTARDSAAFSVRGYEAKPRKFLVYVRDRWGNLSDTLSVELTPVYEIKLDKGKFKEVVYPGDAACNFWGGAMPNAWDGLVLPDVSNFGLHTGNIGTGVPKYFSFDLGVTAQLSRFSLQTVADDKHWYNDVTPKRYEIWGAVDPDKDGAFTKWTKLTTITTIKPSGTPLGILTDDDRTAGLLGDEANFPINIPKVRYIRIRCLENWSGNTNMVISEFTFWGNDK
jgi:hypothetical protein